MYCPVKLKLNKFVHVPIPSNSQYFSRMGGSMPVIPDSAYTGDDSLPLQSSKLDQIHMANSVNMNELRREAAEARNKAAEQTENED